jgi:glycerol-3-phosphate acyltransferase PlsY
MTRGLTALRNSELGTALLIATYILVAVIAYLLGSIPFGYILVRLFHGTDVRSTGSGNIGATNVARSSKKLGIATLALDALKGYLAVEAGRLIVEPHVIHPYIGDTPPYYIALGLAALFAMLGHIFPVWLKFKGGKGVATGVGVFLAIAWQPVLIVLVAFAVIYALTKYVSLGSIVATAAFPVVAYFFLPNARELMPFIIAAAALIIAKHHQNIRRLLSGTEHRLDLKKNDLKTSRMEPKSE